MLFAPSGYQWITVDKLTIKKFIYTKKLITLVLKYKIPYTTYKNGVRDYIINYIAYLYRSKELLV
jgi:hypothetical protein